MKLSKSVIISGIATLLVVAGVVAGLELSNTTHIFHSEPASNTSNQTNNSSGLTTTPANNTSTNRVAQTPPPPTTTDNPANKAPKQFETAPSTPSPTNDITGFFNQNQVVGSNLSIRVTLNQTLATGSCDLTLTNQSTQATINKTAPVAGNPQSSTCEGFDVPTTQLSSGKWNVSLVIKSGNHEGRLSDSVTIK